MAKKYLLAMFWLLLVSGLFVYFQPNTRAVDTSWLNASLTLNEQRTYSLPQDTLDVSTVTGNKMACSNTNVVIRPSITTYGYTTQKEVRKNICGYSVSGGLYGNGYLLKNGTNVAGYIEPTANHNPIFAPPYSHSLVELESARSQGYKVYIVNDAYGKLKPSKDTYGAVTYKTPAVTSGSYLKNSSGNPIHVDPNTVTFSENGQWMLADGLDNGFVRINIATGEILPFASSFSAPGTTVYSINAISNDGKFAVVGAMAPFQKSDLYALDTCQPKAGQNYQSCNSRDLQQYMSTKRAKYAGFHSVKFVTNNQLSAHAAYDKESTSTKKIGLFTIDTLGGKTTMLDYLALGDSFASGEGAHGYRSGTDISDNRCHTSTVSYPFILHNSIYSTGGMQSVACSGAKIKDIILRAEKEIDYNKNDSQAKKKIENDYNDDIYASYLPGYRLQKNFVERNKPNAVTMSIGGNDIGFSSIISKCVIQVAQDCYHYYEDRKELVQNINAQYNNLVNTYQQVKQYAATNAKIYIIGYPEIAKNNSNCANNVHFSNEEIIFSNQLVSYLNKVVKMAADHAGVQYIDISDAFYGSRLCETNSAYVAVNGLTAGDGGPIPGIRRPIATESYHPNQVGHSLMAAKIAMATKNFTIDMPIADQNAPLFPSEIDIELLKTAPKENRTVWPSSYNSNLSEDVLYKNQQTTISVAAGEYSLAPNYSFGLAMYSSPVDLGQATTDAAGNLTKDITIPSSIEPGYHTLHVRGKNILGQDIDLQKIVYVAANEADMNGDGFSDSTTPCGIVSASGTDYDDDGIDDACDGQITEPKPSPTPTPTPTPEIAPTPSLTPLPGAAVSPSLPGPAPTPTASTSAASSTPASPSPVVMPATDTLVPKPTPTPTNSGLVLSLAPTASPTPTPANNTTQNNQPAYTAVNGASTKDAGASKTSASPGGWELWVGASFAGLILLAIIGYKWLDRVK